MEVNVTKTKKEQVKAWINEHKTGLIVAGVVVVTGIITKEYMNDIRINPKRFMNGRKGAEKFLDVLVEASDGAIRYDACIAKENVVSLKELGKVGEELVKRGGLDLETEVTGLMIFTK